MTNKSFNILIDLKNNYYTDFVFGDLFIGTLLITLFIFNTSYLLCSGYGWLPLYIKRRTLEEERKIQELLHKEVNKPSCKYKLLRLLLVIGNTLGLVFCVYDYSSNPFYSFDDTILFFVFVLLFTSNIFYILYYRIDFPCWLLLLIKRKRIEEEKKIKELKV